MAWSKHSISKREELGIVRKYPAKADWNPAGKTPNQVSSIRGYSFKGSVPPACCWQHLSLSLGSTPYMQLIPLILLVGFVLEYCLLSSFWPHQHKGIAGLHDGFLPSFSLLTHSSHGFFFLHAHDSFEPLLLNAGLVVMSGLCFYLSWEVPILPMIKLMNLIFWLGSYVAQADSKLLRCHRWPWAPDPLALTLQLQELEEFATMPALCGPGVRTQGPVYTRQEAYQLNNILDFSTDVRRQLCCI